MKNFILGLLFVIAFVGAKAQTALTNSGDTITNTGTVGMTVTLKGKGEVSFQATVTKISGTCAGTVILQGSLDGTNYYTISTDTLTLGDVATAQPILWNLSTNKYLYYKIKATGSGTMSAKITGYYVKRD